MVKIAVHQKLQKINWPKVKTKFFRNEQVPMIYKIAAVKISE